MSSRSYKPVSNQREIKASDVLDALKGPQGIQGEQGIQGIQGIQGPSGKDGSDGIQGPQGEQGIAGQDGVKGKNGLNGKDGKDGEDGRGIANTYIKKNDLYIEYTDGQVKNVGRVVGKDGPMGPTGMTGGIISNGSGGGGGSGDMEASTYDPDGVNEQLVGLTASQTLTNKSGNISQWTNDSGYITSAPVTSVNSATGVVELDADDIDDTSTTNKFTTASDISKLAGIATGAEVNTIDSGDNVSLLTNDAGYLTATSQEMIVLGINDAQSVDSLTDTALDFNVEYINSGFTHSTSTNPERITVDSAGRYKIEGFISINGSAGNYRLTMRCAVRVNGTTTSQYIDSAYLRSASGSNETCINVFDILDLSADDYIEVVVARISTTSGSGVTTANRTKLVVTKVG